MRLILGITLLLLGAGSLSCRLDGLAVDRPNSDQRIDWVRTAHGWERMDMWAASPVSPLRLHPLVVAAGQVMLSVLALAYCADESEMSLKDDSVPA